MSTILEYKCPCCGGAITFDSSLQKMKCPYCGTEYDVDTLRDYDEILREPEEQETSWESESADWQPGETEGMRIYVCNSCGGQIVGDETLAATACPFCGNPVILSGQFKGDLRPDAVIPFQLDKNAAKEGLRKHLSGKRLLPAVFSEENHLDQIRGIYVPYWLFDSNAHARLRFRATKVRTWSDPRYFYTETRYFSVLREGDVGFDRVPVDGSKKMPDDLMESLEPFDYSKAVDFQTAYLSGYLADRYDMPREECAPRADARMRRSAADIFRDTVHGYATVVPQGENVQLSHGKVRYALYPVWILNTSWRGKNYLFAMNGQTGKFVGDLPMDKGRFAAWFLGLTFGVGAAVFGLLTLFTMLG